MFPDFPPEHYRDGPQKTAPDAPEHHHGRHRTLRTLQNTTTDATEHSGHGRTPQRKIHSAGQANVVFVVS